MKPVPAPSLKDVSHWPHHVAGVIDVVDGQSSETDTLEAFISSFEGACQLILADGEKIGFRLRGKILSTAGIRPEQLDQGLLFRVGLIPSDGPGTPVSLRGVGLIHEQDYEAVDIALA